MNPIAILLGLGAAAFALSRRSGAPGAGVLAPGSPPPPGGQEVPTVRDVRGYVTPQPNTVYSPDTGKSYYVPPPGGNDRDSPLPKLPPAPTVANPVHADPEKAKALAPGAAQTVRIKGDKYDREIVRQFQAAAGLVADGLYGGRTRGALIYYGEDSAPPPVYKPLETAPYKLI